MQCIHLSCVIFSSCSEIAIIVESCSLLDVAPYHTKCLDGLYFDTHVPCHPMVVIAFARFFKVKLFRVIRPVIFKIGTYA